VGVRLTVALTRIPLVGRVRTLLRVELATISACSSGQSGSRTEQAPAESSGEPSACGRPKSRPSASTRRRLDCRSR
jgi:hypothetical protein